jgi:putative ABC transport system substrate-binding protein
MLGLLHELLPGAARFGVFGRRTSPWIDSVIKDTEGASATIGQKVEFLLAGTDTEIDTAFADIVKKRVDAFVLPNDLFLSGRQTQILTLAARHAVPAIYYRGDWARAGGLMTYGPVANEQSRQAGIYAGRILKGEMPADLPVARATRFELIINLATARAIGLTVPATLLAQADEVIE